MGEASSERPWEVMMVICVGCGRETTEDRIWVCSQCDQEFCRSCMADISRDVVCKECDLYVGKYRKTIKEER